MTKKMLIDAANEEEVRVCVLENGKVEEFDFESATKKPLRGNIYLARVTRVEPSLQAAFVEYGGNRHGFLAFNEIHPDYYQIPVSDREALQAAEAEEAELAAKLNIIQDEDEGNEQDDPESNEDILENTDDGAGEQPYIAADDENDASSINDDQAIKDPVENDEIPSDEEQKPAKALTITEAPSLREDTSTLDDETDPTGETDSPETMAEEADIPEDTDDINDDADELETDIEGEDDAALSEDDTDTDDLDKETRHELLEQYREAKRQRQKLLRNYKIQEVIKRRQILLIQVVKEERGNKGAALTSYLSLAGRYCVLMPNTARGGGISRKIPNASDRKRLRKIVDGLDVPTGMGLIIRTAGAKRTKPEIKRDYDYLSRLWENIRSMTLESIAPCLIYEEASLIKRAIRDLYDKDIDQVLVDGEDGYREAKDFMKMLMPSHAKNVQPYRGDTPLFLRHDVDGQLDGMYQPTVRLKSGGYLVINQTEALIAVDVNSGRATRERNIEQTALKTNLEAAKELARQCRLRDLAGLIVVDFIDMEEHRNNRAVEKKFKDALKTDRARIQIGRISSFGLLEMSRQRRRSGIVDGTTIICPTCSGAGVVRSNEMAGLRILRAIEAEAINGRAALLRIKAAMDVVLYILNYKRDWLGRIENTYSVSVEITADTDKAGDQYEIEKSGKRSAKSTQSAAVRPDFSDGGSPDTSDEDVTDTSTDEQLDTDNKTKSQDDASDEDGEVKRKRGRRRRRRRGGEQSSDQEAQPDEARARDNPSDEEILDDNLSTDGASASEEDDENKPRKRRRRGRRGGRRNQRRNDDGAASDEASDTSDAASASDYPVNTETETDPASLTSQSKDETSSMQNNSKGPNTDDGDDTPQSMVADPDTPSNEGAASKLAENPTPKPKTRSRSKAKAVTEKMEKTEQTGDQDEARKQPPRKGWWQRALGG